jgi:hypothetical protein
MELARHPIDLIDDILDSSELTAAVRGAEAGIPDSGIQRPESGIQRPRKYRISGFKDHESPIQGFKDHESPDSGVQRPRKPRFRAPKTKSLVLSF